MLLVISDLEGTLTTNSSSWHAINNVMKVDEEKDLKWYDDFRNGRIDYKTWNNNVVGEWIINNQDNGFLKKNYLIKFLKDYYKPHPLAKEFVHECKSLGFYFCVVSYSFNRLLDIAKKDLGFDHYFPANEMVFDKNDNLVWVRPQSFGFNKKLVLECFREEYKIDYSIGIGDSDNDISLLESVDLGLLVNPSKHVNVEEAKNNGIIVINDLSEAFHFI